MSKGLSRYQKAIMQQLEKNGKMDIIEVCALINYLHVKQHNSLIEPGNPFLSPPPYAIAEFGPQTAYRAMFSLEKRNLVARLLHRRPTVWYAIRWQTDKPMLRRDILRDWLDYNTVMERDGRVQFRIGGKIWERIDDPVLTDSQRRHQERQREWEIKRMFKNKSKKH